MAVNGVSSYPKFRIGGLATGLDTDQMVRDLMRIERIPLDKVSQKKQSSEWKRDSYREITNLLRGLKSEYMDYMKPESNMLAKSSYKKFTATSLDASSGITSNVVSASGGTEASAGVHKVVVNSMAGADTAESMAGFKGQALTVSESTPLDLSDRIFMITVDNGTQQEIKFSSNSIYQSVEVLAKDLQELIDAKVGSGKVGVSYDASKRLMISTAGTAKSIVLADGSTNNALTDTGGIGVLAGSVNFSGVTRALESAKDMTTGTGSDVANASGKKFKLTLDGVTREITMGTYTDASTLGDMANNLEARIATAFGAGKIHVNLDGTGKRLVFSTASNSVNKISMSSASISSEDGLQYIQFTSGASNRINTSSSLFSLKNSFAVPLSFGGGATSIASSGDMASKDGSVSAYIKGITWEGKKFNITVDGRTETIEFNAGQNPQDMDQLVSVLQGLLAEKFTGSQVTVEKDATGKKLMFKKGDGIDYMTITSGTSSDGSDVNVLKHFNIGDKSSISKQLKFTINSKEFTFNATQSLYEMMRTINSDTTAKVQISYDEIADKIRLTSSQMGAGDNLNISQALGNFFKDAASGKPEGASAIDIAAPVTTQGKDSEVVIDGQAFTRATNSVSVGGVTYTLLRESPGQEQSISLSLDTTAIADNITKFMNKYNDVIDMINNKLSEEYDRDYLPLTDEQKESMSEDDIKKWEEKAKSGLLKNDAILQGIADDMRRYLYERVGNMSIRLPDVGITTGQYETKGKIVIDQDKLKEAIQKDPDGVMNLFSAQSSSHPSYSRTLDNTERSTRFSEEGLVHRLYDIIEDNISTFRDNGGYKGKLLEKAGITNDASEFTNVLYKEIYEYDEELIELDRRLVEKENRYYEKFAALERVMAQMNQQSSWLASQLGQG